MRADTSRGAVLGPALLALAALAVHAACWDRYGIFRDELYFIVCGERLAWGYVDQPPGIALVAAVAHGLFGTWVPGLRVFAWLASAATVYLAGRLAARLGGGAGAAVLASAAVLGSPILLGLGHYLTMNAFEPALALGLAIVLVRLADGEDPRLWIAAAGLAAAGALFKYTSALLALSLVVAMLATGARRALRTRFVLAGAAFGVLAVLPNVAWQAAHGFPFVELVRNGQLHKNVPMSPGAFVKAMVLESNPLAAPLWLGAMLSLLRPRSPLRARGEGRAPRHAFLALGALLYLALLVVTKGKPYYAAPAMPLLLAGGAAATAALVHARAVRGGWAAAIALSGLALAPMALPLLSRETFLRYQDAIGLRPPPLERHRLAALPQIFADQHGWEELARGVAAAAATLSPEERRTALVFGQNYGEAGAIDVHGEALGLPPAASGHNQYFVWGTPPGRGDPLLVISDAGEDCGGGAWREKTLAVKLPASPFVMPYEDARWIWICRGLSVPLADVWPRTKHYE